MLKLFDYLPSQNAYKVRLLLHHLNCPYETVPVRIFAGEGQGETYRAINPTGAVPAIQLDDGQVIAESMAILWHLAEGTPYLPTDPFSRAKTLQWLSFENDYLQNSIGSLRYWTLTGKLSRRPLEMVAAKRTIANRVLRILDDALTNKPFLVGADYTIADMACFAYTHVAADADLPLDEHPHVGAWLSRVRAQPRFMGTVYSYSIDEDSHNELP